jgi:hypothetical protein
MQEIWTRCSRGSSSDMKISIEKIVETASCSGTAWQDHWAIKAAAR